MNYIMKQFIKLELKTIELILRISFIVFLIVFWYLWWKLGIFLEMI